MGRHFYHPDETFQGSEVAYDLVYGYRRRKRFAVVCRGVDLPWEWKVAKPIRTTVFPAVYALGFKLAQMLQIDSRTLIVLRCLTPEFI